MDHIKYTKLFWNHYLDMESELLDCLKYVELTEEHFGVYSTKFLKLILECGSEIDNVFRDICSIADGEHVNISDYCNFMISNYPDILNYEARIVGSEIRISPFKDWDKEKPSQSLSWWNSYNNVKHERLNTFDQATLENAINIICAMFILEMHRFHELYKINSNEACNYPLQESKLFILENHIRCIRSNIIDRIENIKFE